ncbi:MAG: serine/threonine protein kinase, partial [Terriglobales bacterium]
MEQVFLKQKFAMKTLNHLAASSRTIRRFQQEAQAASKLEHPNLVRAIDCGLINGERPFFVMELVKGRTLAEWFEERGRLAVDEVLKLFIPLCDAIAYSHEHGVIHRDLKPGNIILAETEGGKPIPKIVDFGIAKMAGGDIE